MLPDPESKAKELLAAKLQHICPQGVALVLTAAFIYGSAPGAWWGGALSGRRALKGRSQWAPAGWGLPAQVCEGGLKGLLWRNASQITQSQSLTASVWVFEGRGQKDRFFYNKHVS